uniref:F-box/LRR-repeat protein 15-like leucin rich repeat domain-containing protein n=1 Tax=Aplanochytrium stocchinoi TaxID=215587 RepID=A0A7S3LP69_9STRA|mmetsp:Transcript_455/g.614  ORF Transcript_455/g.614 Transcript_455/m.614 type:complete len:840 (-) Transcript_455:438-2957(-)|eukprot:CAMPEP_0204862692 /NCGR_PEP_ID=MMETSP1348-20121228/2733_1 /ASSEMBLY_ACC=CAM_ASM_000700 /TAXON_ID=215587 /ORGANISM="Aplanochytrium stocchinoi, Strain GSBS06" /LENGTH=839 /DNA_ID=CAMNT_0052012769 /DNA_START=92 /DNA_END=2611 /DNA_ORIENTATION=-
MDDIGTGLNDSFALKLIPRDIDIDITLPLPTSADQQPPCPHHAKFSPERPNLHSFKGKGISLSGRNLGLLVPECIGEYVLFHFLDIAEICRVRSVSKQFKKFADVSLLNKKYINIKGNPQFSHQSLLGLIDLVSKGKGIQGLSILNCPRYDTMYTNPSENSSFSLALSKLSVLTIRNCDAFTESGLKIALHWCKALVELDCDKVSDDALNILNIEGNKNATFRILKARGSNNLLTNKGIIILARIIRFGAAIACTHHEKQAHEREDNNNMERKFRFSADITGCHVTSEGLINFARILAAQEDDNRAINLPQFSRLCTLGLDLSDCFQLSSGNGVSRSLEFLLNGPFVRLEDLRLNGVRASDALLLSLAENAGIGFGHYPMKSLHLGDCLNILNTSSLLSLAASVSVCEELESLTMRNCIHSGTDGLTTLVTKCQNLIELDLSKCQKGVVDRTLVEIGKNCHHLKKADFHSCDQITDYGVEALVQSCVKLEELNFGSCKQLTNAAVTNIVAWLPKLKLLCLFCCSRITDTSVLVMAKKCAALECLDVSWCYKINGSSLFSLSKSCRTLKELYIEGSHISKLDVQNIIHVSACLTTETVYRDSLVNSASISWSSQHPCESPNCVHRDGTSKQRYSLYRANSSGNVFEVSPRYGKHGDVCTCNNYFHSEHSSEKPSKTAGRKKKHGRRKTLIQSSSLLLSSSKLLSNPFADQYSKVNNRTTRHSFGACSLTPKYGGKRCSFSGEYGTPLSGYALKLDRASNQSNVKTPRRIWGENSDDLDRLRAFSFSSEKDLLPSSTMQTRNSYGYPPSMASPTVSFRSEVSELDFVEENMLMFKLDESYE